MAKRSYPYQAGVIDVGAYSTRLDLFEVAAGGKITLLEALSRRVNLGADVFHHGSVSPENLATLGSVMADFSRKLEEYKVRSCRIAATSAIREAFNRELVVNRVRTVSNLTLDILESQEEIRITFLAMREMLRKKLPFDTYSGLCLSVGTGSLLISWFEHGTMCFFEEVPVGTSRLEDVFGKSFSIQQVMGTLRTLDIRPRLMESVKLDPSQPVTLIAMGASVRMLAGKAAGKEPKVEEEEAVVLTRDAISRAVNFAVAADPSALAAEYEVSEPVSGALAACGAILGYFLEEFDCRNFVCPGTTTRTALIRDLTRKGEDKDPFYGDLFATSCAIGRKYGYDAGHAESVTRLSLLIQEKLWREFDFSPRSRVLMEVAARLHDIGRFVDMKQHHKHSGYLISNVQLPGVSGAEQRVIAAVARYHRKAPPKESHLEYMQLSAEEKVMVLKLAAILRVADALDCTRQKRFNRLRLMRRGHTLVIQTPETGGYRQERRALDLKSDMFNEVFGLELKIEEVPSAT